MKAFWGSISGMYALTLHRWEADRSFILLVLLTILNLADFFLTKNLVAAHGFEAEGNPILYQLMVATGTVHAILWTKVVAVGLMWILYDRVTIQHRWITPDRLQRILVLLNIAFAVIVGYGLFLNIYLIVM